MCRGGGAGDERKCMYKPESQASLKEKVNWGAKKDCVVKTAGVTTGKYFSTINLTGSRIY